MIKKLNGNIPPNYGPLYHVEITPAWDHHSFTKWLGSQNDFPFGIYLNGVTYTFTDYLMRDMFIVGFHARDIYEEENEWTPF